MKTEFYYSNSVDREREFVRQRDNHRCMICSKKWKTNTRRFDVHHIDENMFGKSNENGIHKYDKENKDKLITLCHKCHMSLHKGLTKLPICVV